MIGALIWGVVGLICASILLGLCQYVFRGILIYLKCLSEGRTESLENIRRRYGKNCSFCLVSDLYIFNAFVYPGKDVTDPSICIDEIVAKGLAVKKIRVTKRGLNNRWPEAKVTFKSLHYF